MSNLPFEFWVFLFSFICVAILTIIAIITG